MTAMTAMTAKSKITVQDVLDFWFLPVLDDDYARRHRDVIARFGRVPHRNAIVGRASNLEELAFLDQPGSRF